MDDIRVAVGLVCGVSAIFIALYDHFCGGGRRGV